MNLETILSVIIGVGFFALIYYLFREKFPEIEEIEDKIKGVFQ